MTTATSSPNIMFNLEFSQPGGKSDGFFRCTDKVWNSVWYNARLSASDNRTDEEIAKENAELILTNESESSFDFKSKKNGHTGIFTADNKNLTEEETKALVEQQQSAKGIIWHGILSFADWYGKKFIQDRNTAQELINDCIPKLFEKSELKYSNIMWWGSFHSNTQNNHIHLHFWEKEPLKLNSKGQRVYITKGLIAQKRLNSFKFNVGKHIASDLEPTLYPMRNNIRSAARNIFRDSNKILSAYSDELQDIIAKGHFQYARLDKEQKKVVKTAVRSLINSDANLSVAYKEYKSALKDVQALYIKIYTDSNIPVSPNAKAYYSSRSKDLDSRLINEFLKSLKNFNAFAKKTETEGGYRRREGGIIGKSFPNRLHQERKIKAKVTQNLICGAEQILDKLFFNQARIISEHLETLKDFQLKLLSEGKEIIFDEFIGE